MADVIPGGGGTNVRGANVQRYNFQDTQRNNLTADWPVLYKISPLSCDGIVSAVDIMQYTEYRKYNIITSDTLYSVLEVWLSLLQHMLD